MLERTRQLLTNISVPRDQEVLSRIFENVIAQFNTRPINSAGLVINGAANAAARTGAAAWYGVVGGRLVTLAANTVLPALTGLTIATNRFNVAVFFIDGVGNTSVRFGQDAAAIVNVGWPDFPVNLCPIGALLITHSSTFTGGTTALDTATTVFFSPTGAFDPSFLHV